MKKIILLVALLTSLHSYGQDFPVVWKSKFSFNPDKWNKSVDGKYITGRDESQAEMLDGETGKSLWKLNFSKDLKIKSLARAVYNYEEGVILFFNRDEKKKNGDKVIVDYTTGKELWRTTGYPGTDAGAKFHFARCFDLIVKGSTIVFDDESKKFTGVDIHTGNKKWESKAYPDVDLRKNVSINEIDGSDYAQVIIEFEDDPSKDQVLYINILTGETTGAENFVSKASNFTKESQNRIVIAKTVDQSSVKLIGYMKTFSTGKIKFDLKVTGQYKWSKSFESSAIRQIFNNGVYGAPYVKLDIQGDKIFVLAKSIIVFDLKTGNQLWDAPFDNADSGLSGLKAKLELGIAGWPLVSGDYVYYVDLQNDNAIKKCEVNTGKVIWKSEKIKSNDRVPNLNIVNGVLIAQFGGMINTQLQWSTTSSTGKTDHWATENRFDGDYGVRAYDVNTGGLLWDTNKLKDKLGDKFSDRVTTIYGVGTKVVVASDKNLFSLDAKTGDVVYKTPINSSNIGDVFEMLVSDDNKSLYILCDEGIASADITTGKLNYATKTGEIFWKAPGESTYSFSFGSNYFVYIGEKYFIGFDLATGKIKGKMKWKVTPSFTADGNFIFDRDDEALTKYAVNKP